MGLSIASLMRSLLFVESLGLRPSNQYQPMFLVTSELA
jgi:hypothetical protein